jgi:aspartyl-tRNA(Asn)/glutamyl-tRNA(Gln) amidotransferase subunit A
MVQAIDTSYVSIAELAALYRQREVSPVEVTQHLLERAAGLQERLHAYITLTPELALAEARQAEAALLRGKTASPLLGIPVAYKDIVMTRGIRTTCGSALHLDWVPEQDATVVEQWRAAGTVMLGKLTTWEFASGGQGPEHAIPGARNPWNPAHSPAGSSSGSGAALAAGLVAGAIGTDTGGSIRGPAAYCGITGLKPTYGRVSRRGIVTLAWSLDHAGPMGRTAEDVAYLLTPLAGYDAADPASAQVPAEDYVAALHRGIGGLRLGLATNVLEMADDNVRQATAAAAEVFRSLGAVVEPVTYPYRELAAALRVISSSEAYAYHATDLAELPRKYGRQLEHRTKAGGLYFASEYIQAQRVRSIIQQAVAQLFQHIDVLLCPTMPTEPPTYEASLADTWMYRPGITNLFNLTGQPAVAFPTGFSAQALPLSAQLVGRPFDEATVLRAVHLYQGVTEWHKRHPVL